MKTGSCCRQNSNIALARRSWTGAVGRAMGWIVPGVVIAAMPKCPLCLAAYVTLFTGFGISLAAAKFAWWFVAIGCVAILLYLAAASVRVYIQQSGSRHVTRND
jgi:hypothetical protein